jgi:hypothetical protein
MVADQITQIIDVIAEKLGVAVEMVYPMLMKQAQVECGQYQVILWITGIAALLFVLSLIGLLIANNYCNDTLDLLLVSCAIVTGLVVIIVGLIAAIELSNYLTALHNPDWWAVEYVLKLIK